jgi:hypothetical protein
MLVRLRDGTRRALDELVWTGGSSVSLLVEETTELRETADELLLRTARDSGFAVVALRLDERVAFDSLASFVAEVTRKVLFPDNPLAGLGPATARALRSLGGGERAVRTLRARFLEAGADGELLEVLLAPPVEARTKPLPRLDAWLDGTKLADSEAPLQPLHDRTAMRALRSFSRVVRGLGAKGFFLLLRENDSLRKLPDGRRLDALTVLRELCDNADGARGLDTSKIVISTTKRSLEGSKGLLSLAPLAMRIGELSAGPTSPHEPFQRLSSDRLRALTDRPTSDDALGALRAVVRSLSGLPPADALRRTSVALGPLDATVSRLFELTRHDGSAFALLSGAYGTGKTHLLLHIAARAHTERRPVFRLSLERLDADLGNPQRHLGRLIDTATVGQGPSQNPLPLVNWLETQWASAEGFASVLADLTALAELGRDEANEASAAATKALETVKRAKSPKGARARLLAYLTGRDLYAKPGQPTYRRDAYRRFLLWLSLLERRSQVAGPVLLLDEAENLFAGGATKPERRTALRTLAFYCGGHVPCAAVFLAVTPEALIGLRAEAPELVRSVGTQKTTLPAEDVAMLQSRLRHATPVLAPPLGFLERRALCDRLRALHTDARGPLRDETFASFADEISSANLPIRSLVRHVTLRLERLAFQP